MRDRDRPACPHDGCSGIPFDGDACLAHLSYPDLRAALDRLAPGATIDLRGTTITENLFTLLCLALTPTGQAYPVFGTATFDGAVFAESARFPAARFDGRASFVGAELRDLDLSTAVFQESVRFRKATFMGTARFDGVRFNAGANFNEATFEGDGYFFGADFRGPAEFTSTFRGDAAFGPPYDGTPAGVTVFHQGASFRGAWFAGPARFGTVDVAGTRVGGTAFQGGASFDKAEFGDEARFDGCLFGSSAGFGGARFNRPATFVGVRFVAPVILDGAWFHDAAVFTGAQMPVDTQIGPFRANSLDLSNLRASGDLVVRCSVGSQFKATELRTPDGVNLELDGAIRVEAPDVRSATALTFDFRNGRLNVADASFAAPATIAAPDGGAEPPRLVRMSKVDAENLTLVNLDLRGARFLNCYNRDKLRIEGPPRFAGTPVGAFPRRRWWTARRAIAEEHAWRARYDRRPDGWFPAACRDAGEVVPASETTLRAGTAARGEAARIQAVYRDLRKGREDAKDEPGAADLYYGEMEMRRAAAPRRSVERALLTLYWAVAGYGLRASRAFATLVVVLVLGTVGFATIGFAASPQIEYRPVGPSVPATYRQVTVTGDRPGWDDAAFHALESATSLLRPTPSRAFTPAGKAIEIALRLLGPVLLGLAILSIRSRLKR